MVIDLSQRTWNLQGWRPFYWELGRSTETGGNFRPEFGPYPAILPGSVHTALLKAKVIPDWNVGRNSLDSEWIEHRQWEFFSDFQAGELVAGETLILEADGLDYSGWICVDANVVATFRGALIRHRFDVSKFLNDGQAHRLSIIFDLPPQEQGQIGRTSQTRHFKPRYNFSWDWCVRLVPTGIWDRLALVSNPSPLQIVNARTATAPDRQSGSVIIRFRNDTDRTEKAEIVLRSPAAGVVLTKSISIAPGESSTKVVVRNPELWWPNRTEKSALYELEILDSARKEQLFSNRVGFKHVRWLPCKNAPKNARPLLCEINGRVIFLQGVNWTPIRLDYPGTQDSDYRKLIDLYQKMGCNVLRVWGGGYLEKEVFYRYCDEAGLMIWQEFPLSSSGIENEAPTASEPVSEYLKIATDYIRRRSHHASLLAWCGGNELTFADSPKDLPLPLNETHPTIKALVEVVKREQPEIRLFPTSPSGPVFYAHREKMGQGIHHHVHGPWDQTTADDTWKDYWLHDDALLRSEAGCCGAASLELLQRYVGPEKVFLPTFENLWWRHSSAWWLQWEIFKKAVEEVPKTKQLARYVELSQERQARFLKIAAKSCKRRFPQSAGFIIWMGHDSFPCPTNTSIIDFDFQPKPAYAALRSVFRAPMKLG